MQRGTGISDLRTLQDVPSVVQVWHIFSKQAICCLTSEGAESLSRPNT